MHISKTVAFFSRDKILVRLADPVFLLSLCSLPKKFLSSFKLVHWNQILWKKFYQGELTRQTDEGKIKLFLNSAQGGKTFVTTCHDS